MYYQEKHKKKNFYKLSTDTNTPGTAILHITNSIFFLNFSGLSLWSATTQATSSGVHTFCRTCFSGELLRYTKGPCESQLGEQEMQMLNVKLDKI